jgi:sigma-B regulation protein RsbU (phosphoserine phosphatase)
MVDSPAALLRAARSERFDLILADLNYARDTTSGHEGLDLLASLDAQGNATPVIVMTAWGSVDLAVEAMRRGACDFIQKPWDNTRVIASIRKQAESERRRKSELEIAANVQQKLFPRNLRRFSTIDYAGRCVPAREVSGDYYDFLDLGGGKLGIVLADVSGKGIPAALLMANLQACFRSQSQAALLRPGALLENVNRLFFESTAPERYATLFFAVYDDSARTLQYVNCGHVSPILMRGSSAERLCPTATVLGAFSRWSCREVQVTLQPEDTLLLYSDGVTEAGIETGEEFGETRLLAAIAESRCGSAEALVHAVVDTAGAFGDGSRNDDITVVAVRGI